MDKEKVKRILGELIESSWAKCEPDLEDKLYELYEAIDDIPKFAFRMLVPTEEKLFRIFSLF